KDAGLSNMEVILAATMENARFFQIDSRLGSIEEGKIADLILLREDPLQDLKAMRSVEKVMLNGVFVDFE
ncbi:MAG: amidohydrolase family protein, partial [Cyclobacteriaceae bacterium]